MAKKFVIPTEIVVEAANEVEALGMAAKLAKLVPLLKPLAAPQGIKLLDARFEKKVREDK